VTLRRAAALAALALVATACGSSQKTAAPSLPASGPPGVVRIGLAHLLWPLDPARARTRDEIVVARALFATPLRTDAEGRLRPGLCTSWRSTGTVWRLRCRRAGAIARELRRTHLVPRATARNDTLTMSARSPYVLTEVAAAPPGVPGRFRLISASPKRIVAERTGLRVDFRKLEPHSAARLFRQGKLDEAPVPLGDIRADLRNPTLAPAVRVRRLLAVDLVLWLRGSAELRHVYDDTADRADYQALVPEFEAPPAETLSRPAPSARAAVLAASRARKKIGSLPKVATRFAMPPDPDLAYGAGLLVAAWRDIGLGAHFGHGRPDARFERVLAPYPRAEALRNAVRGKTVIPIAWAVDARLVSPRLRGWREDALGAIDYTRVKSLARPPRP
jgi:hypothetical protein